MNKIDRVIIFGGTGFIGTHLAQHLLSNGLVEKLTIVDLKPARTGSYAAHIQEALRSGQAEYVQWDVREPIPASLLPSGADIIFNLAAIHREPGHQAREYFETNIRGAGNVCEFASATGCKRMVFTSSISPYGPSEEQKDETALPVPETPYGSSKLVAEAMHRAWCAASPDRRLMILRPGVVYGPGEGGNVTRLIRSVAKGYFVYVGNRKTRKAGGYVKELCLVAQFGLEQQDLSGEPVLLLNFSMNPPATLEEFVDTIKKVTGSRHATPSIPRSLILGASYLIQGAARAFGIQQPINPVRVRKLYRSTFIDPKRLRDLGYTWKFTLEDAMLDWKQAIPGDFAL